MQEEYEITSSSQTAEKKLQLTMMASRSGNTEKKMWKDELLDSIRSVRTTVHFAISYYL